MSDTLSPASSSARLAACAFKPSPDMVGTRPISDSPTPTIATLFLSESGFFIGFTRYAAAKLRDQGSVAAVLECHFDRVSDRDRERIVAEQIRHHSWTFIQI